MAEEEEEDQGPEEPSAPFWMATFSDMATLLLTFFVLIVSMSEVEVKKFKDALSQFQGRTGVLRYDALTPTVGTINKAGEENDRKRAEKFEEVLKYLEENNLEDKVQVNLTREGLHVSITDSVMFVAGRADLLPVSQKILQLVSKVLDDGVHAVRVEGHTDDRPIRTGRFPSNWELSAGRAGSVVRYLLELETAHDPAIYTAVGYGEYHPVASNDTPEGRASNRRVEILFSLIESQDTAQDYGGE